MENKIVHSTDICRFETVKNGVTAYVEYEFVENGILITHTVVPEKISGLGVAAHLVQYVLKYAKDRGIKVVPKCSYVKTYMQRHPDETL